jgi:hypothetical protein
MDQNQKLGGRVLAAPPCVRCCQRNAIVTGGSAAAAADAIPALRESLFSLRGTFGALGPYGNLVADQLLPIALAHESQVTVPLGVNTQNWLSKLLETTPESLQPLVRDAMKNAGGRNVTVNFQPKPPLEIPGLGGASLIWLVPQFLERFGPKMIEEEKEGTKKLEEALGILDLYTGEFASFIGIRNDAQMGPTGVTWPSLATAPQQLTDTLVDIATEQAVRAGDCEACVRRFVFPNDSPRKRLYGKFRRRL